LSTVVNHTPRPWLGAGFALASGAPTSSDPTSRPALAWLQCLAPRLSAVPAPPAPALPAPAAPALIQSWIQPAIQPVRHQLLMPCRRRGARHFDVIVYGDEPAGLMTALELHRTLRQLAGIPLGGTIARSGLSYLDRNQVPQDMAGLLPPFAPSSDLYQRFLRLTGVQDIAVDPRRASRAFVAALKREGIPVYPRAVLVGAAKEGERLCVLQSRRFGSLGADLFIDASLGAGLAHRAGVAFLPGLGPRGLSRESIALGWIFEVQGLSLRTFQALEEQLTHRLLDRHDPEAQRWFSTWQRQASAGPPPVVQLLDEQGRVRVAFSTTSDSADQRSPVLSMAFHGEEEIPLGLVRGSALLDRANIAILSDRLSFNALLFRNTAAQNRQVLAAGVRPLPQ
ncbi:MAG: FAD-dependent oxidoreductase, partial [Synechococcaceae bacterium WB9_2_170]|nr:FAD-dependent oxidoreductase [Synechococcaceae bacterium WB9_2_170]